MTLKRPLWMQSSGGDPDLEYSGLDDRAAWDALIVGEGVVGVSSLKVTQRGAGANMSVDVAAGFAAIQGDDVATQGKYLCQSTATENKAIPAPPVSGSRTHRVIAQVKDKTHNGAFSTYEWILDVLPDVGSGTPALPASAITLALVTVTSSTTSIATNEIDDQRPFASTWRTRPPSVATFADLPGSAQMGDRYIVDAYAPIEWVWGGSAWNMDGSAARIYRARGSDAAGRTSTTPSADDTLTATLIAGVTYELSGVLFYVADAAGDFKYNLNPPTAGTVHFSGLALPDTSTGTSGPVSIDQLTDTSNPVGGGSGATVMTATLAAKVWSGDGGTFSVDWSRSGGTGNTVLKQHSFMVLTPVGF